MLIGSVVLQFFFWGGGGILDHCVESLDVNVV